LRVFVLSNVTEKIERNVTDYPDHEQLTKYLLGELPSDAAERLDELSITDDEFAALLNDAENDLVDAYTRGNLSKEMESQFRSAYSTPKRRQKVAFAEVLSSFQQQTGRVVINPKPGVASEHHWWPLRIRLLLPQWGLAAAAAALLVASGYLTISNEQLKRKLHESEAERASLTNQRRDLRHQLESQSLPDSGTAPPGPSLNHLKIATFVLAPSLRGSAPLPTVALSSDAQVLVLRLELDSSGFPRYVASVEDAVSRRSLWQSADLMPFADGDKQAISFAFPPSTLAPGTYLVEVRGIRASGSTESLSTYPFRVVLK
jgi:hypothetical protein